MDKGASENKHLDLKTHELIDLCRGRHHLL